MAASTPSSPKPPNPNPDDPQTLSNPPLSQDPSPPPTATISAAAATDNPNPNPPMIIPPPPSVPSFAPSYRPLVPPSMPHYSPIPNPGIQPPGVPSPASITFPGMASGGAGTVTVSMPHMRPGVMYPPHPGQPPMQYSYMAIPGTASVPPPGIPRYPTPYHTLIRPGFPPRPPAPMVPTITRPPIPGIRGAPPMVTPVVRPVIPIVPPTEKPQTTVYVGKIAPTVDNEFLLSLLRLCGPVKSWKRAQDPTDGTPKGFGFCEFEAAEGVLRGLRLLSKLRIDGLELVLNINQATREYLERYVEKKTVRERTKEMEGENGMETESAPGVEKQEPKKATEETKKGSEDSDKGNQDDIQKFGIVTSEDREADREAMEKITSMIEERLKTKPLPPPPPVQPPPDGNTKSTSEVPSRSKDAESDVDIMKNDAPDSKNDEETTSEIKSATEQDKLEATSSDKGSRHDRRSRERDLGREKERELERYERDRERERVRRERDRELKMREADRLYTLRVKEWEAREREKEHVRRYEKDRQKERERERRRLIINQEAESDDEDTRRRKRKSSGYEEKRRKRQKEKEEDLVDRLKEEEEIAEAKRRATEEKSKIEELKLLVSQMPNGNDQDDMQEDGLISDIKVKVEEQTCGSDSGDNNHRNGSSDEQAGISAAMSDTKQNNSVPIRKLGFGLVGSGKRTAVPSVFHEEDDEGVEDKKLRPLVPIDYSTDEVQAVQTSVAGQPPNLVAAAEFAKRISGVNSKDDNPDMEKESRRWSSDRSSHRERTRYEEDNKHTRDESKEKLHKVFDGEGNKEDKSKNENKKLLDAKQLIDMIPKTKEELFAYPINWDVYDKHKLHERMRPWISKKITEFLGEEEDTLVDYIVTSTKEHKQASGMLEMLQAILDDEAEMFVLKMWRMLIFEIKKVETGLVVKPRS